MKKESKNISGIKINDSIIMSVKKRRKNFRELESLIIALCGYVGIIMFFLNTFTIPFDIQSIVVSSSLFAVIYGTVSTIRGKTAWTFLGSLIIMGLGVFRYYREIKTGFCLVFNIMYKRFTDTGINYFKSVNPIHSEQNITIFLVFAIWLLSFVIFFFTIYRPNILIIVTFTFPIIEICLYYGIEVPVIWTSMIIGYWFSVLSICSSDLGEYFGGGGGFTRKDDAFFPKRKMKFKVTEKCALSIIALSVICAFTVQTIIDISGYKRTEQIKEQRRELKNAINSFSMEDLASSISNITESLGFSIEYQDNRLGKFNKVTYKGKTDLLITLDDIPFGAVYLKGFTASEYGENEWLEIESDKYQDINSMFEKYNIYPQEFPYKTDYSPDTEKRCKIKISSQKKNHRFYVPYGLIPDESFSFLNDNSIKRERDKNYSFEFYIPDASDIQLQDVKINTDYYNAFTDEQNQIIKDFSDNYNLNMTLSNRINLPVLINYDYMITMLVENQYRKFVYENYLEYPDNEEFKEIRQEYADILDNASTETAQQKLDTLNRIKEKINNDVKYTLEPGKTPSTRDFTNYFLLENKKGYCVHYATAGVMLARMAGIPARYATGYISVLDDYNEDSKNPDGSYTVKLADNRSHAWAEIYIDGLGWIPFEFTAGYSNSSIANENPEEAVTTSSEIKTETNTTTVLSSVTSYSNSSSVSKNSGDSKSSEITTSFTTSSDTGLNTAIGSDSSNTGKGLLNNFSSDNIKKIFAVILIFLLIFIRRWIIIILRNNKLNSGKSQKRIINNYNYVMRLLKYLGAKQQNLQYIEFADSIEEKFGDEYFKKGLFSAFNEIILKYSFGNNKPTKDDLAFLSAFSKELSENIFKKSNIFEKAYLKLISVLV